MLKVKKAAMFGLDARIALAIFGALSVISGAALYSAVQEAKARSYYQYLIEYGKAIEAYYLDTGVFPYRASSTASDLTTLELVSNIRGEAGWKGPYISDFTDVSGIYLNTATAESIGSTVILRGYLFQSSSGNGFCTSGNPTDCSLYVAFKSRSIGTHDEVDELFTLLDNVYDNGDGVDDGLIRDCNYAGTNVCVKYMPRRKDITMY